MTPNSTGLKNTRQVMNTVKIQTYLGLTSRIFIVFFLELF